MVWSPVPDFASPGRPARVALAVALIVALVQTARDYGKLALSLGDTDDALRLFMVRDLMAGHGWFHTHLDRLQPPAGLDMHWSRLLDGAMAAMEWIFRLAVSSEMAELLLRLCWPLLWVFPLTLGAVLVARRLGGSPAVLAAAIFIASIPVQMQFGVGRVDHHNAQMALSLLVLAGTVQIETRWGPWLAGIATGLLLAIGLEALVFAALCGTAIALRFAADERLARPARIYGFALGASTLLAFFAQTPPRLWTASACDMLSVNLLAGLVCAAFGLVLASFVRGTPVLRLVAILTAGGAALAAYLALDPACIAGPFAHMDPRLRPDWLDHVIEAMTWPGLWHDKPALAAALLAPALLAIAGAAIAITRDRTILRDPAWLLSLAIFAASVVLGLIMVRSLSYTAAFSAIVLAGAFPRVVPSRIGEKFVAAAVFAFIISPTPIALAAAMLAAEPKAKSPSVDRKVCSATASFADLARLPPGLVLADIDAGPHLLAHTPHSALAAPYHRMNEGIAKAHDLWSTPAASAAAGLKSRGIAYVMLCPARGKLPIGFPAGSLRAALEKGAAPDFLDAVPAGDVFRVWRVR